MSEQTPPTETISVVFDLIRQYAEREGWIPIGFRSWRVGAWTITVNGTAERTDDLDPYHARIVNEDYVAIMILHPYGGSVGGWKDTEDAFIADMRAELAKVA
jgi:hypothetical protein